MIWNLKRSIYPFNSWKGISILVKYASKWKKKISERGMRFHWKVIGLWTKLKRSLSLLFSLKKKKKIKFKQRICWCASLTLKQKRKKKWNCCKRTERLSNKAVWIIIHRRSNNYSAFPFRVDVQCDSLTSCSARANSQLKIWIKNFLQLLLHINFVAYKRLPYIIVLFQRDF